MTVGRKDDQGKLRWELLPLHATQDIVKVLTYGAQKYEPENWRHVPDWRARYHAAAMRHLVAWAMGERDDPESGLPHLAHLGCCVMFLAELDADVPSSSQRPGDDGPTIPLEPEVPGASALSSKE